MSVCNPRLPKIMAELIIIVLGYVLETKKKTSNEIISYGIVVF
jgi:hypothetical protein